MTTNSLLFCRLSHHFVSCFLYYIESFCVRTLVCPLSVCCRCFQLYSKGVIAQTCQRAQPFSFFRWFQFRVLYLSLYLFSIALCIWSVIQYTVFLLHKYSVSQIPASKQLSFPSHCTWCVLSSSSVVSSAWTCWSFPPFLSSSISQYVFLGQCQTALLVITV